MLEQVNLELKVPKAEYRHRLPALQDRLFDLEHAVFQTRIPVMVVLEGWGASGKGGVVQVLAERMDPRGFHAYSVTPPRTIPMICGRIPAIAQMPMSRPYSSSSGSTSQASAQSTLV